MQVNFFNWLRQGVKQAVLSGVTDAIDQIGTPEGDGEMHTELMAALSCETPTKTVNGKSTTRKRLGRSLKELNAEKAKK